MSLMVVHAHPMAGTRSVPERLHWAVETLGVQPGDQVLEIGCGGGVAVPLVCERLTTGRLVAIDRSPTQIDRAASSNADLLVAGKVQFRTAAFKFSAFNLSKERFEKIFAVNVNTFWTTHAIPELALTRTLLSPGGALHLYYEPPSSAQLESLATKLADNLEAQDFGCTTLPRPAGTHLLGIIARPR
jgi:cyclopropane fatty-acyl-phospholipid synthase-like methyltransferase